MRANPDYFKALLSNALNGNHFAWCFLMTSETLESTARALAFHVDGVGRFDWAVRIDSRTVNLFCDA